MTCCTTTLSPLVNARILILSRKNISFQNHVAYKLFNSSRHKQFMSFLTFGNFRGSATFVERKRTFSHFISVLKGNNFFGGAGGWVVRDDTRKDISPNFIFNNSLLIFFLTCVWDTAEWQKLSYHQSCNTLWRIPNRFYLTLSMLCSCKCWCRRVYISVKQRKIIVMTLERIVVAKWKTVTARFACQVLS